MTMLFLLLQGTQVVASGKRRWVDPHWRRGMSYLKLGWNWIRLAITHQGQIPVYWFLSSAPDPHPASASKKQSKRSLAREFVVLRHLPVS
ncbi:MAG: transposase [Acaryochloridaceae cyanobacterium SU_2_1]|nr:transposase [Acaryochloridaceae cyanobacterium SU_2_1]